MSQKSVNLNNLLQSLKDTAFYCHYFKKAAPLSNQRFMKELLAYCRMTKKEEHRLAEWGLTSMQALKTQVLAMNRHCRLYGYNIFRLAYALRVQDWNEARKAVGRLRLNPGISLLEYGFEPSIAFKASLKQIELILETIAYNIETDAEHKNPSYIRKLYQESEEVFSELHNGFRVAMKL